MQKLQLTEIIRNCILQSYATKKKMVSLYPGDRTRDLPAHATPHPTQLHHTMVYTFFKLKKYQETRRFLNRQTPHYSSEPQKFTRHFLFRSETPSIDTKLFASSNGVSKL